MYKDHVITEEDRQLIEALISCVAGLVRLPDILRGIWPSVEYKTRFGIWFKRAVENGEFAGITVRGKSVENHQLYHIAS